MNSSTSSLIVLFVLMAGFFVLMSFGAKRANKKRAEQQNQMMSSLKEGQWVMTVGRMYGRVVDVDGDVVVLETMDGTEMLFDRDAIAGPKEPPFAKDEPVEPQEPAQEEEPEKGEEPAQEEEPEKGEETDSSVTKEQ